MNGDLTIEVRPRDDKGRHLAIATHTGTIHKHRFDVESQFHRRQFREAIVSRFALDEYPDVHAYIEEQLIAGAVAVDAKAESGALWTPKTLNLEKDVEAKPVRWFWPHYMPEGAFTVLDGDPEQGKSTIALDLVARFSRGDAMPPYNASDDSHPSGNSLLLSAEDDLARTIKPRLQTAGARVERVEFMRTASIDGEDERFIGLPDDVPLIEKVVVEKQIKFIVVDVLAAFLSPGLSMNSDEDMRRVAGRLHDMLERTRATALVLRHFNKKEGFKAMYRGAGSIAIVGAARAAFAVAPNPTDPYEMVFAPIKSNLGPRPKALTYCIEPCGDMSNIAWGGQTDLTAADVLHSPKRTANKVEAAKQIIVDILDRGPCGENEVQAACKQAGVSEKTYRRARKALGILSEKSEFCGQWLLTLPSTNGHHDEDGQNPF